MTPHDAQGRSERAFTLIEMIIVLVLLALAMLAVFPAIGNMLRGNSRTAASAQATGEVGVAARLLESDIRAALGERGTGERVMISNTPIGSAESTILSLHQRDPDVSDIVAASPTDLTINADVYSNPGIERVRWRLVLNNATICGDADRSGRNFCLERSVRTAGGAVLSVEVPIRGRGTYPTSTRTCATGAPIINTPRVFCYQESMPGTGATAGSAARYVWNGGWIPTCTSSWNAPGTPSPTLTPVGLTSTRIYTRHNAVDPANSTSITRLDRITGVGAVLISGGGFGRANERSYDHVEITIRSRESEAYKEAIMCGTRAGWGR